jgi:hypothetical protein
MWHSSHSNSLVPAALPGLARATSGVGLGTQIRVFYVPHVRMSACPIEGSRMGEFAATLQVRLREAHASLKAALDAGDAQLTDTQLDEIEHLRQIAAAHGISEPVVA